MHLVTTTGQSVERQAWKLNRVLNPLLCLTNHSPRVLQHTWKSHRTTRMHLGAPQSQYEREVLWTLTRLGDKRPTTHAHVHMVSANLMRAVRTRLQPINVDTQVGVATFPLLEAAL